VIQTIKCLLWFIVCFILIEKEVQLYHSRRWRFRFVVGVLDA